MTAVECCECGQSLDIEDAHWAHEPYCFGDGLCTCDLHVCAECCRTCQPHVIPGQVSLLPEAT